MYNDPSGEFAFLAPIVAWVVANAAAIGTAALISAGISAGLYLAQAAITGNFSWSRFAKSIFMGALTGAVSGGLGQVFSSSGFWATVGNSALAGAGSNGITALINGTNFFEGLAKGAVIGGAIGAVSYGIGKSFQGNNNIHEVKNEDLINTPVSSSDDSLKYSYHTLKDFEKGYGGLGNHGVEKYYLEAPKGYMVAKDGSFYKANFWDRIGLNGQRATGDVLGVTVGSDIYISKYAFTSKALLTEVVTHETGHVIFNNSNLASLANTSTNFKNYTKILDNWGHVSIRKMSLELAKKNPWMQGVDWLQKVLNNKSLQFMRYLNNSKSELDKLLRPLIKPFNF